MMFTDSDGDHAAESLTSRFIRKVLRRMDDFPNGDPIYQPFSNINTTGDFLCAHLVGSLSETLDADHG